MTNTIFALSTPPGKAALAVIRLSGPMALRALDALCDGKASRLPNRQLTRMDLYNPETGSLLDQVMLVVFRTPHSYTGEDCAEIHCHGGRAVTRHLLAVLGSQTGLRLAEAGEFTRRALQNGKQDLLAVEGLSDLLSAETQAQRKLAQQSSSGDLLSLIQSWRSELIQISGLFESLIDFSDEDLPDTIWNQVLKRVQKFQVDLRSHLADGQRRERVRDGLSIALIGAPNVGKSSLLNALAQRDVAIVTDIAGTTRDRLEVQIELAGFPLTLFDTAGLRDTCDKIEEIGIERARATAQKSDLSLFVFDDPSQLRMVEGEGLQDILPKDLWLVYSKQDLSPPALEIGLCMGRSLIPLSVEDPHGLAALLAALETWLDQEYDPLVQNVGLANARHFAAVQEALMHLDQALNPLLPIDLQAEEVRLATRAISRIAGLVDVEDILDVIFSQFCIGK